MIRSLNSKWHGILDARQGKGHYSDIMSNILLDEIDPTNSILYQIFLLGKTLVSDTDIETDKETYRDTNNTHYLLLE